MEKNFHRGGQLVVRERIFSSGQLKILGNQPQNLNGRLTDVTIRHPLPPPTQPIASGPLTPHDLLVYAGH